MGLIEVDTNKCKMDGICVAACPVGILAFDPKKGPKVRALVGRFCVGCGHCVAVCPHGALNNVRNPLAGMAPLPAGGPIAPETAMEFLRSRRSIRCYADEPVARESTLRLLEAARYAPTGHNTQGVSFLVLDKPESIRQAGSLVIDWMRKLLAEGSELATLYHVAGIIKAYEKGEDRIFRNAPQVVVATADKNLLQAQPSTYLKLEYVELYAPTLGLGTCWAGYAQACARQYAPMREYLGIGADRVVTGIMMLGRPKYAYHRLPERDPLDVSWHGEASAASAKGKGDIAEEAISL